MSVCMEEISAADSPLFCCHCFRKCSRCPCIYIALFVDLFIHFYLVLFIDLGNSTWSEWGEWSLCVGNTNCRDFMRHRCRHCIKNECNTEDCTGTSRESEPCNNAPCQFLSFLLLLLLLFFFVFFFLFRPKITYVLD